MPYNDSKGIPTIGYGHKIEKGEDYSKGISKTEADSLFKKDVAGKEMFLHKNLTVKLSQNKWDALLLITYNFGTARPKIFNAINGGRMQRAIDSFMYLAKQDGEAGIIIRTEKERAMWNSGTYPDSLTR